MTGREPSAWGMVLTPFTPDGTDIDHASLVRLVRTLLTEGMTGVIALGVIAEPDTLSLDEKRSVLDTVTSAAGEAPVLATVMSSDPARRAAELATVAELGDRIAGLMVPVTSDEAPTLRDDLETAHARTGLPLVIQDYPAPTGIRIDAEALVEALAGLRFVQGVKCEAAPTFARIRLLRERYPELSLISGLGGLSLVDDLAVGADGLACGITRPHHLARALQRWHQRDPRGARALVAEIAQLISLEVQAGTSIGIRKEHWRRRGVIDSARVRRGQQPYPGYLSEISDSWGYPDPAG